MHVNVSDVWEMCLIYTWQLSTPRSYNKLMFINTNMLNKCIEMQTWQTLNDELYVYE